MPGATSAATAAGQAVVGAAGRRGKWQQFWSRARPNGLWQQARARSSARGAALGAAAGVGAGLLGGLAIAGYTLRVVHSRRNRGYTDEFVLTPEDLNMPYQEVQFFTEDGVSLTGWFIPQSSGGQPSRRIIVCCHPYNSSKSNLLGVARGFWERRYSVFMFDFRSFAHAPTRQSVGYFEQRDARAAIACARRTAPPGANVGLVGASMGGAVALLVGHEAETAAVGIATDCAFASLQEVIESTISRTLRLPGPAAAAAAQLAGLLNPLLYGYGFSDVAPTAVVAEGGSARAGQVPLLLVHAENDEVVCVSQAHAIHAAAAVPEDRKQLVVVQHCHHIGCFFRDRLGYMRLLDSFFDGAFERAEAAAAAAVPRARPPVPPVPPVPAEAAEAVE